ncbi:thioredoxin family protein [Clostridium sp. MSJ-11]|uniref:Thioredoxin family protein n=1 Tax=Clostridium mobile TaxID=2841512 RepID=A0ABS6EEZ2_9CLOT|nr:thioredoxin family protein [Clostridium mobile]MBU5483780.1 thioredoxin family protein [Clostridium mobile]
MITLNSTEEIKDFIKENDLAFIYFSSNNCSVCHALLSKIEELLKSYPKIKMVKVEIDNVTMAAGEFSVFTLPCILMFAQGKEIIREARFISIMELEGKIQKYYNLLN